MEHEELECAELGLSDLLDETPQDCQQHISKSVYPQIAGHENFDITLPARRKAKDLEEDYFQESFSIWKKPTPKVNEQTTISGRIP